MDAAAPNDTELHDTDLHETDLQEIADRLFGAFVAHDFDTVRSLMAPDAVVVQNGNSMAVDEAMTMIASLRGVIGDHRYEEVRRVVGAQAIVEEHRVRSTTPAGRDVDLMACVVVRVNDDGKIVALDEYVDTAPLTKALR